jgi:phosphate transport system permease protein
MALAPDLELESLDEDLESAPRRPRRVRRSTVDDYLELGGAFVSSGALVGVLYGHVFNMSGVLGFLVCWYLAFMVIFGLTLKVTNPTPLIVDRLVQATVYVASLLVIAALLSALIFVVAKGVHALGHLNFFTHDMAGVSPTAPLNQGGIYHAIIGTLVEIAVAIAISLPLGLMTSVFLSEVGGRWSNLVRTVVEAMTALPEILAGLFVYVVLIVYFGFPRSGFAVSVAMSVTMVPIIARTGEVALRIVPNGLREASNALGGSEWRTTWKVVLPSARAGLATALILAIARGIGETAIPLICSGASSFTNYNPFANPMNSLPLFILTGFQTGQPVAIERAFGAGTVLLVLILGLFVLTRYLARDRKERR